MKKRKHGTGFQTCLLASSIIFFFLWKSTLAQDYVASWTGNAKSYQVQRSKDKINWTIIKNTTSKLYTGTGATYYWRIKLFTDSGYYYSNIVWVYGLATITSAKISTTGYVSWKGYSETNLSYYTVANEANFLVVPKKTTAIYSVKVSKSFKKYNIIGHYKNGEERILKTLTQ